MVVCLRWYLIEVVDWRSCTAQVLFPPCLLKSIMISYLLIGLIKLIFMILVYLLQLWLIPWVSQFLFAFKVAPSKNSSSIESHFDHLKIGSNMSHDLYWSTYCAIMTGEGSAFVKVVSSIVGYKHCLCSFHVNQLAVRVSYYIYLCGYTFLCGYTVWFLMYFICVHFYVGSLYVIYILKSHVVIIAFYVLMD